MSFYADVRVWRSPDTKYLKIQKHMDYPSQIKWRRKTSAEKTCIEQLYYWHDQIGCLLFLQCEIEQITKYKEINKTYGKFLVRALNPCRGKVREQTVKKGKQLSDIKDFPEKEPTKKKKKVIFL